MTKAAEEAKDWTTALGAESVTVKASSLSIVVSPRH